MKRRSSSNEQPNYTFFTDADLVHTVPNMLRNAGISVERHDDHFIEGTLDEIWMPKVIERDWVILTHDKGIRYTRDQTDLLMNAGGRMFVLIMRKPNHEIMARNFINSLDKVHRYLKRACEPFIGKVTRPAPHRFERDKPGNVDDYLTYEEWLQHNTKGSD